MKRYTIYIALFWLMVFTTGCKKYLDEKSNDKLVTPQTLADLQGLMDDADIMNFKATPGLMETMADDYFMLPANYDALSVTQQNMYKWILYDIQFSNDWSAGYKIVYNANLSMDLLNKIDRTADNAAAWDNVRGSALFFRAYSTLLLATQYAKVYNESTASADMGVVLRDNSDFNIPSVRASVRDTYNRVIADATESIALLPNYPLVVTRPSKTAAYGLLARAYLYMGKYAEALNYANEALKLNSTLMDYNGDSNISSLSATAPFKRFNAETVFYTELSSLGIIFSPTRSRIDTTLVATYNAADLRKTGFFTSVSGYQQFKGNYTAGTSLYFSGLAVDEFYLIRAESNAWLGNLDAALSDVNTLLKKRWDKTKTFVPVTGTTRVEVLNKVRLERRKEMIFRGVRWIDLKRYNREGENITIRRKIKGNLTELLPNASFYAIPLPADIVVQGLPQN